MSEERQFLPDKVWARVRGKLRQDFGESVYRSWFKPLVLHSIVGSEVELSAPTTFMQERIETQYADRIKSIWMLESNGSIDSLRISVLSTNSGEDLEYGSILDLGKGSPAMVHKNIREGLATGTIL